MKGRWNQPRQAGIISDERQAWVTLPGFDFITFIGQGDDEKFSPDTPPVRIELRQPGRRYNTRISLTQLTEAELIELKKFFDHAFEKAQPICRTLDERAKEAFVNGNDGHSRLYRPVPIFYDRERFLTEHSKGIQERPARLVDGVEGEGSGLLHGPPLGAFGDDPSDLHSDGTGVDGSGVANEEQGDMVPQHDEQEALGTKEVREVPRDSELPW